MRFREVLDRDGAHHGALLGLARQLTGGDRAQRLEALALCDGAILNQPGAPDAHHARGVVLERLRRFPDAAQAFREAWQASESSMDAALHGLALALHKAGKTREALAALNDLASLRPLDPGELLVCTHLRLHFCEWATLDEDAKILREAIATGRGIGELFPALALCVPGFDEEQMHKMSAAFAQKALESSPVSRTVQRNARVE